MIPGVSGLALKPSNAEQRATYSNSDCISILTISRRNPEFDAHLSSTLSYDLSIPISSHERPGLSEEVHHVGRQQYLVRI